MQETTSCKLYASAFGGIVELDLNSGEWKRFSEGRKNLLGWDETQRAFYTLDFLPFHLEELAFPLSIIHVNERTTQEIYRLRSDNVALAPDGKTLVYVELIQRVFHLKTLDLTNGNNALTVPIPRIETRFFWSPDSEQIGIGVQQGEDRSRLQFYQLDGDPNITVIELDHPIYADLTYEGHPQWSPNGEQISVQLQTPDGLRIHLVNVETREVTLLRNGRTPRWSHQGDQLAYFDEENLNIYPLETGEQRTFPFEGIALLPSWSPDDRQIAYLEYSIPPKESLLPDKLTVLNLEDGVSRTFSFDDVTFNLEPILWRCD
ncbi:MAG: hypothetical protein MUF87_17210 [Anaerolineae bacterium]|nr:hypothetical protein [Anaerolineae bacterium]